MNIKAWTIYIWRNGNKMEGAAPVKTKDGVKEVYCYGWKIEKDPEAKRNEEKHQVFRAKARLKSYLNDTLNVLNWYGKKVLDRKGNIDAKKLEQYESVVAFNISKHNLKHKKHLEMDDVLPLRKFPYKNITLKQAKEYKFK